MSTLSGLGGKGEKNKSKFTTIKINDIFKGSSSSPQRTNVSIARHGLQSLGKVGGTRRMPPPANLPSLKSENSGNDPSVNLVPTGGSGWGAEKGESGVPTTSTPPSASGPAARPAVTVAAATGGQQLGAALSTSGPPHSGGTTPSSGSTQTPRLGAAVSTSSAAGSVGGSGTQPTQGAATTTTTRATIGADSGAQQRSWSGIAGAGKKRGIVDQNSPFFREEFPTLAAGGGGEDKSVGPVATADSGGKAPAESKESPYGPGPSLRPQNVASWREGGGRAAARAPSSPDTADAPPSRPPARTHSDDDDDERPRPSGGHGGGMAGPPPPHGPVQGGPRGPPHMPGAPMMGPPFRMHPPFMYGPRPGYGPGFQPNFHPGMRPPFPPGPFPDQRMRGPGLRGPPPARRSAEKDPYAVPASIIKHDALKEFDDLDKDGGGWAGAEGEIDYSAKLVFSDDESTDTKPRKSPTESSASSGGDTKERTRTLSDKSRDSDRSRDADVDMSRGTSRGGAGAVPPSQAQQGPPHHRNGWMGPPPGPPGPHYGRPPMEWQGRMPFDGRPPMPGYPNHTRFRMPGGPGQRPPFPFPDDRPPQQGGEPHGRRGDDEPEEAYQRQRKKEEVSEAVERARLRRDEEEQRIKNLKVVEERLAERRKGHTTDKDKDDTEERREKDFENSGEDRAGTLSSSSDSKDQRQAPPQQQKGGKGPNQKMPPRLQRQMEQNKEGGGGGGGGGSPHPPMPRPGQGPPPPHWGYGYPHMQWQGMPMPPQVRRQMSGGEAGEGGDGPRDEMGGPSTSQYDPRGSGGPQMWRNYPHVPQGWDEAMRRGAPHPYYGYPTDHYRDYEREKDYETEAYDDHMDQKRSPRNSHGEKSRDSHDKSAPGGEGGRDGEREGERTRAQQQRSGEERGRDENSRVSEREVEAALVRDDVEGEWEDEEQTWGDDSTDRTDAHRHKRLNWAESVEDATSAGVPSSNKSPSPRGGGARSARGGGENKRSSAKSEGESRGRQGSERRSKKADRDGDEGRSEERRRKQESSGKGGGLGKSGQTRRGAPSGPVPISSQMARETIGTTPRSNFTSLKRSLSGNTQGGGYSPSSSDKSGFSSERKTDSPKESSSKSTSGGEEKTTPQRPSKENQKRGKDGGKDSPASKPTPPPQNAWAKTGPPPALESGSSEPTPAEDQQQQQHKGSSRKEGRAGAPPPPENVWAARNEEISKKSKEVGPPPGVKTSSSMEKASSEGGSEDRPPAKKSREERGSASSGYREERRMPATDYRQGDFRDPVRGEERGARSVSSGRGRSGAREYVRGGRGRGRSSYPVRSAGRGGRAPYQGEHKFSFGNKSRCRGAREDDGNEDSPDSRRHGGGRGEESDEERGGELEAGTEKSGSGGESASREPPQPPRPLTSRWSDVARDKSQGDQSKEGSPALTATSSEPVVNNHSATGQAPPTQSSSGPVPPLMSLNPLADKKEEEKPQLPPEFEERRRGGGSERKSGRGERRGGSSSRGGGPGGSARRSGDGYRANRDDFEQQGFEPQSAERERQEHGDSRPTRGSKRGGSAGRGSTRRQNGDVEEGEDYDDRNAGYGGRGRGRFAAGPGRGGYGHGHSASADERSEERRAGKDRAHARHNRHQPPRFAARGASASSSRGRGRSASDAHSGGADHVARDSNPNSVGRSGGAGRGHSAPGEQRNSMSRLPSESQDGVAGEAGEEWETASESSDLLGRSESVSRDEEFEDSLAEPGKHTETKLRSSDSGSGRKSFPPPRDRPRSDNRRSGEHRRGMDEPGARRGGGGGGGSVQQPMRNGTEQQQRSSKENVALVYQLRGIEHADPTALQNALNTVRSSMKSLESEPTKPTPRADKKNALADIDMNNYASVVVIDDQPEVSTVDEKCLLDEDEGFQEVTSRRTAKSKKTEIAAAQAEQARIAQLLQSALVQQTTVEEATAKSAKKSRKPGMLTAEQKRMKKLPPRLAKMKAEALMERKHGPKSAVKSTAAGKGGKGSGAASHHDSSPGGASGPSGGDTGRAVATQGGVAMASGAAHAAGGGGDQGGGHGGGKESLVKIENWDNEMARSIPPQAAAASNTAPGGVEGAAPPPTNAWDKPINLIQAVAAPQQQVQQQVQHSDKYEKRGGGGGDQHDSGIDVSEAMHSAASSTRSSPNSGPAAAAGKNSMQKPIGPDGDKIGHFHSPKPQRQSSIGKERRTNKPNNSGPVSAPTSATWPAPTTPTGPSSISKPPVEASILKKPVQAPPQQPQANKHQAPPSAQTQPAGPSSSVAGKPSAAVEPIQLPASFKDQYKYKRVDSSDLKLDFTFDAELARLNEEQLSPHQELPSALEADEGGELALRINSARKIWEIYPTTAGSGPAGSGVEDSAPAATQQSQGAPSAAPQSYHSQAQSAAFSAAPQQSDFSGGDFAAQQYTHAHSSPRAGTAIYSTHQASAVSYAGSPGGQVSSPSAAFNSSVGVQEAVTASACLTGFSLSQASPGHGEQVASAQAPVEVSVSFAGAPSAGAFSSSALSAAEHQFPGSGVSSLTDLPNPDTIAEFHPTAGGALGSSVSSAFSGARGFTAKSPAHQPAYSNSTAFSSGMEYSSGAELGTAPSSMVGSHMSHQHSVPVEFSSGMVLDAMAQNTVDLSYGAMDTSSMQRGSRHQMKPQHRVEEVQLPSLASPPHHMMLPQQSHADLTPYTLLAHDQQRSMFGLPGPLVAPGAHLTGQQGPSLYMQPAAATGDVYSAFRGFAAAPAPQQPPTIMVSSTSSLMSASIKPASQQNPQYMTSQSAVQKSTPLTSLSYGGYTSPLYLAYDLTAQSLGPSAAPQSAAQQPSAMQSRVQGLGVPPQANAFSATQPPLQQTGFYQQSFTPIQLPMGTGFGSLGLQLQQQHAVSQASLGQSQPAPQQQSSGSQLNKSAPPFKPAAQKQAEMSMSSAAGLTLSSPSNSYSWASLSIPPPPLSSTQRQDSLTSKESMMSYSAPPPGTIGAAVGGKYHATNTQHLPPPHGPAGGSGGMLKGQTVGANNPLASLVSQQQQNSAFGAGWPLGTQFGKPPPTHQQQQQQAQQQQQQTQRKYPPPPPQHLQQQQQAALFNQRQQQTAAMSILQAVMGMRASNIPPPAAGRTGNVTGVHSGPHHGSVGSGGPGAAPKPHPAAYQDGTQAHPPQQQQQQQAAGGRSSSVPLAAPRPAGPQMGAPMGPPRTGNRPTATGSGGAPGGAGFHGDHVKAEQARQRMDAVKAVADFMFSTKAPAGASNETGKPAAAKDGGSASKSDSGAVAPAAGSDTSAPSGQQQQDK